MSPEYAKKNRTYWNRVSDKYQHVHGPQLNVDDLVWGVWGIPESELRVLGEIAGKDILELGCGGAQWSIALAKAGARPVGLDSSERQLEHARSLMADAGVTFPFVCAGAETVPLPDASFDIVFCDHGATTFSDPQRSVPEAARLLRPSGIFAFNIASPILELCWDDSADVLTDRLQRDYFGMRGGEDAEKVVFQLTYGEWIRLFRRCGLAIEDLIELRPPPGASTTYTDYAPLGWALRWPAENIWKTRKPG